MLVRGGVMIGIIGAMEEEVSKIKSLMLISQQITKAGMNFTKGKLEKKDVVVVRSGIGKVNAGICTQILIDLFNVDLVINTGIAGAIDNMLDIGDIVVSTDALQTDMDASGFGYEIGQIPRMDTKAFKADEYLVNLAVEKCRDILKNNNVFKGRISTMDKFVSDNDLKNKIKRDFGAYCTEMEGAAIAQTAYLNDIKFIIIRAISDRADGSANVDYEQFEKEAIKNCTNFTIEILRAI